MTLLGRLREVVGAPPAPAARAGREAGAEPIARALTRLRGAHDRRARADDEARLVGTEAPADLATALPAGAVIPTDVGPAWSVDTRLAAEERHGAVGIGEALTTACDFLETLTGDARLRGFDPRDALYLDIEATGLEHGAGTMAFMIGLGHHDGAGGFVVRQLVLREPEEERAMLTLLWEAIHRHPFLVSFNGKSFDLSVLQARLVMQRFCTRGESEIKLRPHLDLLHLCRALFKAMWPDVRLQTLERRVLGFERQDDMPGSLAPLAWFRWLREADARPLAGVARHNFHDVLSMLALTGAVARATRPVADAGRRAAEALNLARLYARRRAPGHALAVLDGMPPLADRGERIAAHELGATCARRVKDHAARVAHLEAWVALDPDDERARAALVRAGRVAQTRRRA
ncbi:MAG: ribonuclease H-like domain-containing protein [Deltaproteobacteria bacterium]|nr:ribonuclease H-like domain-containing protein [Deltaproteobacteria bacterium]